METVTESRPGTEIDATEAAVSGRLVAVLPDAVERTCGSFAGSTRRFMTECGVETLEAEHWYSQVTILTLCEQLQSRAGRGMLERLGRYVPELTEWQVEGATVETRLAASTEWYDTLHRAHDGSVRFQQTGLDHGKLLVETPYPTAFEEGLARGIARQIQTEAVQIYVSVDEDAPADVSRYDISWYRLGTNDEGR